MPSDELKGLRLRMALFDRMPAPVQTVLNLAPIPGDYTIAIAQMIERGYSVERAIMWVLERYRSALNTKD